MALKTIQGSESLAKHIKDRRLELGLTIEDAAFCAGVGTKTWCRYESGESIRSDKCKGICKALKWHKLPEENDDEDSISLERYRNHEYWSKYLEERFGSVAALSFAVGSDILLDNIKMDMDSLASMPAGSHIGQLGVSLLSSSLPEQFLTYYDYEFVYQMKCVLQEMRMRAKKGLPIIDHSILQELIIYLCAEEAASLIELSVGVKELDDWDFEYCEDWVFDLFDDMDIITFLYSDTYLSADHPFHFSNWGTQKFWMS